MFEIDSRSLAAFRIAIGLVLLVDLGIRATDLGAMYTDDGMFSRAVICRYYSSVWNWSFHFGGGSWVFQAVLFAIAVLLAVALLVGYETRLATVASWLMLVSLHNRIPPLLNGGDNLMRMLLFWGMFLPLGRTWSIDHWLAARKGEHGETDKPVLSAATAAILLQMAFVYLFSAVFKSNANWLTGQAISTTLAHRFYGTPIARTLLQFPGALRVLTVTILVAEWLGPILLLSPLRTRWLRVCVVGLLATMHLGIDVLLNVGLFSWISISGLLLFLPSFAWDALARRLRGTTKGNVAPTTRPSEASQPAPARATGSWMAQAVCVLAFAYVVFVNVNGLPRNIVPWTPVADNGFLPIACGLGQKWNMFAEAPSRNGWYVARATLVDGTRVDLLRQGHPVVWETPKDPAAVYPNHRWLKCFREMSYSDSMGYQVFREPVAEFLCHDWNRHQTSDKQVADVALVFCMERVAPSFRDDPAVRRETLVHLNLGPQ